MQSLEVDIKWVLSVCKKPPYKVLEPTIQALSANLADRNKDIPSESTLIKYAIIGILITQVRLIDEKKLETISTEVFRQVAHAMVEGTEDSQDKYVKFVTEYQNL